MTRTTGNSVSGVVRRLGCVKNEAVGVTAEDAREHVRVGPLTQFGDKTASPLELLLESADVELGTDSESAIFCRTPRTPEQSAATWFIQRDDEDAPSQSHEKRTFSSHFE
jgi:hypothetical protein